jgi:hypothetical protein
MGFLSWIRERLRRKTPLERKYPDGWTPPSIEQYRSYVVSKEPRFDTFPVNARLRVRSPDYERLTGKWEYQQLNSQSEYTNVKANLLRKFRENYGMIRALSGKTLPRWNERSWKELVRTLCIDIAIEGAPAEGGPKGPNTTIGNDPKDRKKRKKKDGKDKGMAKSGVGPIGKGPLAGAPPPEQTEDELI